MKHKSKSKSSKGRGGAAAQGHVRVVVRSFLAINNVPATVVQTVGELRADSSGLVWISTIAAMADIFRYWRLNSISVHMWPAVSSSYTARTYWPTCSIYMAPFGSAAPTIAAEVEVSPRLLGVPSKPFVFPNETTTTDPVFIPDSAVMSIKLRNNDFVVAAETDRPGYLLTQQDGSQVSYGTLYAVKRTAGSGTSTNWDGYMDLDVSFLDLLDPTTISALMEHRANPNVSIDQSFLRQAIQEYSSSTMVRSPTMAPPQNNPPITTADPSANLTKDEVLRRLTLLFG